MPANYIRSARRCGPTCTLPSGSEKKPFDTVNREVLWKIMQKFGCSERFTQIMRQPHDGMMARVTDNEAVSEASKVTKGVTQDCILAPTLFSLIFAAMLMDAYRDERPGIRVAYRTEGQLPHHRRTHFQMRESPTPSTNFSSRTTAPSTRPRQRRCNGASISSPPPPSRTSIS
nr:unnamed protein product [Spirometra erinaceieuropaei]